MFNSKMYVAGIALFTVLSSPNLFADSNKHKIVVGADIWCPYNCDPKDPDPGYLIEVLQEVFEPKGYEIVYRLYPWQRALDLTEKGYIDAAVGAVAGNHGENLIGNQALGMDETVLVVRKGEGIDFDRPRDLDDLSIGVIADYTYDNNGTLDDYLAKRYAQKDDIYVMTQDQPLKQLFKMLELERIDVFPENRYVAKYNAYTQGSINDLRFVATGKSDQVYVAFSPNEKGEQLLQQFDDAVGIMKEDGRLEQIMADYGIEASF